MPAINCAIQYFLTVYLLYTQQFLSFNPIPLIYSSFLPYLHLVTNSLSSGEGNGTPLQYSCLENPMDGGA